MVLSLTPLERTEIRWAPGEREACLATLPLTEEEAVREARRADERAMFLRGGIIPIHTGRYLELEDLPVLAQGNLGGAFVSHHDLLRLALARHGEAALPTLLRVFATWPREVMAVLDRVDATAVASFLGSLGGNLAGFLDLWARSHAETAALALLPAALGPDGEPRNAALKTLRLLRKHGEHAAIAKAGRAYGETATTELDALFAPPPLPPKAPKIPGFVAVDALPVLTADGEPLPRQALDRLLQLSTLLPQECARAALDTALPELDRGPLADLAEALLRQWLAADAPTKEKWVLYAAALLGDDRAVRALVARLGEWSEAGLAARAKLALDAVVSIGSDVALMHVSFLTRSKGSLKKAAAAALERYRESAGLSEDELADRTVPDLGLDARGTMSFDYGARSYRAGFDEDLQPYVVDHAGTRASALPRPTKADDPAKAARAQELWRALKAETKALAAAEMRRLERAMVRGRTWDRAAFERYFLTHPLMQHLARRLVWGIEDAGGPSTFRIAEDGTLSTDRDEAFTLPDRARMCIVHPLAIGAEVRARWSTLLADYRIIQPFDQIGRELFTPTPEERGASTTDRWKGRVALGERFFSLKHRGWRFADYDMSKPVGDETFPIEATLRTEPGLHFLSGKPEDQTLGELSLGTSKEGAVPTFGDVHPIAASELFRDVDALLRRT